MTVPKIQFQQKLIGIFTSSFKFIACCHIPHIYVGSAGIAIQIKLSSAVILEISARGNVSYQKATIQRLNQGSSGLDIASKLREELRRLQEEKAENEENVKTESTPNPPQDMNMQPGQGLNSYNNFPGAGTQQPMYNQGGYPAAVNQGMNPNGNYSVPNIVTNNDNGYGGQPNYVNQNNFQTQVENPGKYENQVYNNRKPSRPVNAEITQF